MNALAQDDIEELDIVEIKKFFQEEEKKMQAFYNNLMGTATDNELTYHFPDDLLVLKEIFDPQEFILDMHYLGMIDVVTGDYSCDCTSMCNNAAAYIIAKLSKIKDLLLYDIEVVEGYFSCCHHTWIKIGDYYVDITLKQFVPNANELSITLIEEVNQPGLYQEITVHPWHEWVKLQF